MKFISSLLTLVFVLGLIFCAILATQWLGANPGTVTFDWLGAGFTTSVSRLILWLLVGLFLFFLLVHGSLWLVSLPKRLRQRQLLKRYETSTSLITSTVLALENQDIAHAQKHLQKLTRLLPDEAITLWSQGRISEAHNDLETAKQSYQKLRHHKKAYGPSLRNLHRIYTNEGNHMEAMYAAEKLFHHKRNGAHLALLLNSYLQVGRYDNALKALDRYSAKHPFSSHRSAAFNLTKKRAICLTMLAQECLKQGDYNQAYTHAIQAYKLAPNLIPAAEISVECTVAKGKSSTAIKLIETLWQHVPYTPLIRRYLDIKKQENPEKRYKQMAKFLTAKGFFAGHLAAAELALEAKDFDQARIHAKQASNLEVTQHLCQMMEAIERQDSAGQADAAAAWHAKASLAAADATWHCTNCNHHPAAWHLHCPVCGTVESTVWGSVEDFKPIQPLAIETPTAYSSITTPQLLEKVYP